MNNISISILFELFRQLRLWSGNFEPQFGRKTREQQVPVIGQWKVKFEFYNLYWVG